MASSPDGCMRPSSSEADRFDQLLESSSVGGLFAFIAPHVDFQKASGWLATVRNRLLNEMGPGPVLCRFF